MDNKIQYAYTDEQKKVLYYKIRILNPKKLYFMREENGETIYNLDGCRKVLYHLDRILWGIENNKVIYLVEGEKDVATMENMGFIATTAHTTTYWCDEFTEVLKNADVVILYDYDVAGIKRKDELVAKLTGNVQALRVVDLPGLEANSGQDITDWIQQGHTREELLALIQTAKSIQLPQQSTPITQTFSSPFKIVELGDFIAQQLPEREMLLSPIFPVQGLAMISAQRGVGKTQIALGIAYTIATGGTFLRWNAPKARKVIYIDGEMPACLMQERLKKLIIMSDGCYDKGFFHLFTPDYQETMMPDLATKEGRDALEVFIEDRDCIFLDNISCLFRTGTENDSESWQEAQSWALDLRRRGKSVFFVHHAGKNNSQRGTSKKEDTLDTVIKLTHPEDYKPEQGACFEIEFTKSRHFFGEDANSFIVQLFEDANGAWRWEERESKEDEIIQQYAELKAQGFTDALIGEKMNKKKGQIETIKKKARNKGLVG